MQEVDDYYTCYAIEIVKEVTFVLLLLRRT